MLGILIAFLCDNATQLQANLLVQDLVTAEKYVERAEYAEARDIIFGSVESRDVRLQLRLDDLRAVVVMRAPLDKTHRGWASAYFQNRVKANPKDVRYRAWYAEALLLEGRQTESLAIMADLKNKDLMPDAFAYVVLAKLSIGAQRESALAACTRTAQTKSICVVPKPKR